MTEVIRTIQARDVRTINEIIANTCPMAPRFIPVMIAQGTYAVVDETGKRLPTEQALKLLE